MPLLCTAARVEAFGATNALMGGCWWQPHDPCTVQLAPVRYTYAMLSASWRVVGAAAGDEQILCLGKTIKQNA